jgi:hypothetical protein
MAFKVLKVLSENSFIVSPEWRIWKLKQGGKGVKASYTVSKKHEERVAVKKKLINMLPGKQVELKNIKGVNAAGFVICDVYLDGVNLSELIGK